MLDQNDVQAYYKGTDPRELAQISANELTTDITAVVELVDIRPCFAKSHHQLGLAAIHHIRWGDQAKRNQLPLRP